MIPKIHLEEFMIEFPELYLNKSSMHTWIDLIMDFVTRVGTSILVNREELHCVSPGTSYAKMYSVPLDKLLDVVYCHCRV